MRANRRWRQHRILKRPSRPSLSPPSLRKSKTDRPLRLVASPSRSQHQWRNIPIVPPHRNVNASRGTGMHAGAYSGEPEAADENSDHISRFAGTERDGTSQADAERQGSGGLRGGRGRGDVWRTNWRHAGDKLFSRRALGLRRHQFVPAAPVFYGAAVRAPLRVSVISPAFLSRWRRVA